MRKINFPLILGIGILLILMLMYMFPALFTDKDPLFEESPKYIEVRENGEWVEHFGYNPMPPNRDNIMGTDDAGRDVYVRLVYGTRNTLSIVFLVALFRMLIAFPLGLAAGMGAKFFSMLIKVFNTFFTAVPILIFSYIILNIAYFTHLQMDKAIVAFAIVFTALGWAKLAGMIEDSTRKVMSEDFIEGEIAIGKTKLQIAFQNILPHLIPDAVSLFFKEMGMAMFLIAQLAVFNVFVGVTREINALAFKSNYDMILEPEWGGTLSRIAVNMRKFDSVYWMTIFPVLLFSVAIVGFNLLGEGLRIEFHKRNSRVISDIRKVFYYISPKLFITQLKDIKHYYKPVAVKLILITGIVLYFVIPWHPSRYDFDVDYAMANLEQLISADFKGRVAGTEGGYQAGEYIISKLSTYGYQVDETEIEFLKTENDKVVPKDISPVFVDSGYIKIVSADGSEKTFELYKDFSILSINREVFTEEPTERLIYKGIAIDSEHSGELIGELTEENTFFPMTSDYPFMNKNGEKPKNLFKVDKSTSFEYDAEFFMGWNGYEGAMGTQVFNATVIVPYASLYDALSEAVSSGYSEVEINLSYPQMAAHPGRNITGFLPGKGRTIDDPGETIIIGASYDGVYNGSENTPFAMCATPAATALEIARVIGGIDEPLEKSILFMFWDNEAETGKYTQLSGVGQFHLTDMTDVQMSMAHGFYYIDIAYPGYAEQDTLNLTTLPAQRANGKNYLIGLEMEERLKEMDVKYRRYHYEYAMTEQLQNMRLNALTSIGVGNTNNMSINGPYDEIGNLSVERIDAIGQLILDTLTMNEFMMNNDNSAEVQP